MKDYAKSIVDNSLTLNQNLNRLREYIQTYLLYVIYKDRISRNLVFTGGTALRFVHKIRRFSEDVDFSLSDGAKGYDFEQMIKEIQREFELAGYELDIKHSTERTMHSALLKFSGILFEAGLSPLKSQKITIKMEVDINPPKGGKEENSSHDELFVFFMLHYDLASLYAGKLNAVLTREYTKGRDFYDLFWYLTKHKELEPNFTLLNNSMVQAQKNPLILTPENWKREVRKVVERTDFAKVRSDVIRFLERPEEAEFLELKTFESLLR